MIALGFTVLLVFSAILSLASLANCLRQALSQFTALKLALRECPERLELRYNLREIVVGYDATVVPLRPDRAFIPAQPKPYRAAA